MSKALKIVVINGTYRKGGAIDSLLDEIAATAREAGAEVRIVRLMDARIEFCANCRACTQTPGDVRGVCPIADDMGPILDAIAECDSFVLASPMNFFTVTAVMKRFIERLVCFADWPWGAKAPRNRAVPKNKRAVLVISSAAPAILGRLLTRMAGLMKTCAGLLGAKKIHVLWAGMIAIQPEPVLSPRLRNKARAMGRKLLLPV